MTCPKKHSVAQLSNSSRRITGAPAQGSFFPGSIAMSHAFNGEPVIITVREPVAAPPSVRP